MHAEKLQAIPNDSEQSQYNANTTETREEGELTEDDLEELDIENETVKIVHSKEINKSDRNKKNDIEKDSKSKERHRLSEKEIDRRGLEEKEEGEWEESEEEKEKGENVNEKDGKNKKEKDDRNEKSGKVDLEEKEAYYDDKFTFLIGRKKLMQRTYNKKELRYITAILCEEVPNFLNKKTILINHFSKFGKVRYVECLPDDGTAEVHFKTHKEAKKAVKKGKVLLPDLPSIGKIYFWDVSIPKPSSSKDEQSRSESVNENMKPQDQDYNDRNITKSAKDVEISLFKSSTNHTIKVKDDDVIAKNSSKSQKEKYVTEKVKKKKSRDRSSSAKHDTFKDDTSKSKSNSSEARNDTTTKNGAVSLRDSRESSKNKTVSYKSRTSRAKNSNASSKIEYSPEKNCSENSHVSSTNEITSGIRTAAFTKNSIDSSTNGAATVKKCFGSSKDSPASSGNDFASSKNETAPFNICTSSSINDTCSDENRSISAKDSHESLKNGENGTDAPEIGTATFKDDGTGSSKNVIAAADQNGTSSNENDTDSSMNAIASVEDNGTSSVENGTTKIKNDSHPSKNVSSATNKDNNSSSKKNATSSQHGTSTTAVSGLKNSIGQSSSCKEVHLAPNWKIGEVSFLHPGYGFVRSDQVAENGSKDEVKILEAYFLRKHAENDVKVGDTVKFELNTKEKTPTAINVMNIQKNLVERVDPQETLEDEDLEVIILEEVPAESPQEKKSKDVDLPPAAGNNDSKKRKEHETEPAVGNSKTNKRKQVELQQTAAGTSNTKKRKNGATEQAAVTSDTNDRRNVETEPAVGIDKRKEVELQQTATDTSNIKKRKIDELETQGDSHDNEKSKYLNPELGFYSDLMNIEEQILVPSLTSGVSIYDSYDSFAASITEEGEGERVEDSNQKDKNPRPNKGTLTIRTPAQINAEFIQQSTQQPEPDLCTNILLKIDDIIREANEQNICTKSPETNSEKSPKNQGVKDKENSEATFKRKAPDDTINELRAEILKEKEKLMRLTADTARKTERLKTKDNAIKNLQKQLDEYDKVKAQSKEIDQKLKRTSKVVTKVKAQLIFNKNGKGDLMSRLKNAKEKLDDSYGPKIKAEDRASEEFELLAKLCKEVNEKKKEKAALDEDLTAKKEEIVRLKSTMPVKSAQNDATAKVDLINKLKDTVDKQYKEIRDLKQNNVALDVMIKNNKDHETPSRSKSRNDQVEKDLAKKNELIQNFQNEIESCSNETNELIETKKDNQKSLVKLENLLEEKDQNIQDLHDELDAARARNAEMEKKYSELAEDLSRDDNCEESTEEVKMSQNGEEGATALMSRRMDPTLHEKSSVNHGKARRFS